MNDRDYMQIALQEAEKACAIQEIPVGAIVVCQGRIIARAHNQVEMLQDATAHAEILASTMAFSYLGSKYLTTCTLYVTLEPCCMCAGALYWAQLGRLVFGAQDQEKGYGRLDASLLHPRTAVRSGICAKESTAQLQTFFKNLRK